MRCDCAFSEEAIEWLCHFVDKYLPDNMPAPYIFPMETVCVSFVWMGPHHAVHLAVDPHDKDASVYVLLENGYMLLEEDAIFDNYYNLTNDKEVEECIAFIRRYFGLVPVQCDEGGDG